MERGSGDDWVSACGSVVVAGWDVWRGLMSGKTSDPS